MLLKLDNGKTINLYSGNVTELEAYADFLKQKNTTKEQYALLLNDIYNHNVFAGVIFKSVLNKTGIKLDKQCY